MHPQDIRAGSGALQGMLHALDRSAQSHSLATQAFGDAAKSAFDFAAYFENKARYADQKAAQEREESFKQKAYDDEIAHRDKAFAYQQEQDKIANDLKKKQIDLHAADVNERIKDSREQRAFRITQNVAAATAAAQNAFTDDTIGSQGVGATNQAYVEQYGNTNALNKNRQIAKKSGGNPQNIKLSSLDLLNVSSTTPLKPQQGKNNKTALTQSPTTRF